MTPTTSSAMVRMYMRAMLAAYINYWDPFWESSAYIQWWHCLYATAITMMSSWVYVLPGAPGSTYIRKTITSSQLHHLSNILYCHISHRSAAAHEEKQQSLFQQYMKKNNRAPPNEDTPLIRHFNDPNVRTQSEFTSLIRTIIIFGAKVSIIEKFHCHTTSRPTLPHT